MDNVERCIFYIYVCVCVLSGQGYLGDLQMQIKPFNITLCSFIIELNCWRAWFLFNYLYLAWLNIAIYIYIYIYLLFLMTEPGLEQNINCIGMIYKIFIARNRNCLNRCKKLYFVQEKRKPYVKEINTSNAINIYCIIFYHI